MKPKFSIIIPLAPERKIEVTRSIEKLDYQKNKYEVIINIGKNPSRNRNLGIKKAKGEILAFVDDDAIVDKNWLKNAEHFFKKYPNIDIVGGPQLTPKTDNFFSKISGYAIASFIGTHIMSNRYKKGKLNLNAGTNLTSVNLFMKKKIFEKINGFDKNLYPGEEIELLERAKSAGFKIAYSPDIIVYHKRRSSLISFCLQFFSYGENRAYQERIRKKRISFLFMLPSLFIIYIILLPFLFFINMSFFLPIFLYFLIIILASINISIRNKNILSLSFLPFVFLFLHISYGLGLIYGLIKRKKY